ncbi:MAG: zinc ribbon domain-containing protein [Lachnospiraceae bacterium]|nr:zinc ribbon domain-containing protein [Lachnospiraceae bacterium]
MYCINCGIQMKEGAKFCPKCGTKYQAPVDVDEASAEAAADQADEAAPEAATESTGEADTAGQAAAFEDDYDKYFAIEDEPVDKSRRKYYIVGAIAVAAVVFLICFCNTNTFKRLFYKPADYYRYVEKKNAHKNLEQLGGWLEVAGMDGNGDKASGREESLNIGMSDDILDAVSDAFGVNADFLKEINITGKSALYGNLYSGNVNLSLGSDQVLALNTIADSENDNLYLRIPELSDDYLGFNTENLKSLLEKAGASNAKIDKSTEDYLKMMSSLPKAARVIKIADRYADLVFDNIEDVKKSGMKTLELGGVKQKCWVLTVKLDYRDLKQLGEALKGEVSNDKDLKAIVSEMAESADVYEDEAWDAVLDAVDDLADDLTYLAGSKMEVYVDSRGHVISREITAGEAADLTVTYGRTIHGREFGALLDVKYEGTSFTIEGIGRKSGEIYFADFTLGGSDIDSLGFSLNCFDHKAFEKQKIDGEVSVRVGDIMEMFNIDHPAAGLIEDYLAVLTVTAKDVKSYEIRLKLADGKSEPFKCTYTFKDTGASKISVPEDAIMVEKLSDMKDYLAEADFDCVQDNLERAGVPESLTKYFSYIQKFSDYIDYFDLLY